MWISIPEMQIGYLLGLLNGPPHRRYSPHNRYTHTVPPLTHGSDLRLAPTLGPVAIAMSASPKRAIQAIAGKGFQAIQLDATLPGLRPRELDTSARRDLASTLSRSGLALSGIDLFIPPDHFIDPEHQDRATEAACAACALAGEIGRVPVGLKLPIDDLPNAVMEALLGASETAGVTLAVYADAGADVLAQWIKRYETDQVVTGIDPAALLVRRDDPAAVVQACSERLGVARLSDAVRGQADGRRVSVGSGDLDLLAYRVSIDLAPRRQGPVVLDLRGLANPLAAAAAGQAAWQQASMTL